MRTRILATVFALFLCALAMNAQGGPSQALRSPLLGVWRGDFQGMPGVTVVVTDEGGALTGAVLFYFQSRKDEHSQWTSTPGLPEPMLNPKIDGDTLTFQISHRRAHPPRTLGDPPVAFHLKLNGTNDGEFANEREGPSIHVTRTEY